MVGRLEAGKLMLRPGLALALVLSGVVSIYIAVMTPYSLGEVNDDALYLTTAKALATGQGYKIISLPYQPAQTKYPPVYPFLLSLIWRTSPNLPANLTAMILFSVLASTIAAILAWLYLTRHAYASGWWALIIVALTAINVETVARSTGVFPEMPYTALSIGAMLVAEDRLRNDRGWCGGIGGGLVLGLLIGLTCLTRVAGITLLLAIGVSFILNRRVRKMVVPIAIACLFILVWTAWAHYHRDAYVEENATYYTDYFRYSYNLIKDAEASGNCTMPVAAWAIIRHNAKAFLGQTAPLQALGYYHDWLGGVSASSHDTLLTVICSAGLLIIALGLVRTCRPRLRLAAIYVLLYLVLHILLPFPDNMYGRYLVPVLPFIVAFLVNGLRHLAQIVMAGMAGAGWSARKVYAMAAGITLFALSAVGLLSYADSLRWAADNLEAVSAETFAEDAPAMAWIRDNTSESDVLACVRHARYFLYTGRRATLCFPTERSTESRMNGGAAAASNEILKILEQNKVNYLVLTSWDLAFGPGGVDYSQVLKRLGDSRILTRAFVSSDGRSAVFKVVVGPS